MIAADILLDGFFAAVAAVGFGAVSDPPMRAFPCIALLAAVGHALRFCLMNCAGMDIATASLCAATASGSGSLWLGKAIRCPMTALYIPALLPMVPGIYAYKTVFSLIMFLQSLNDPGQGKQYMQLFFRNATVSLSVIALLAEHAAIVARYQGGNNAGHTVVTEKGKFILNLLPSGILHPDVTCVLGTGMVIDLDHLANEMQAIEARGVEVSPKNLKLSVKATISMPWHKVQDGLEEDRLAQKGSAFGSTRRGIAYAYSDKYRKKTLRLGDLLHLDEKRTQNRLRMIFDSKNMELAGCYHQQKKY